MTISDNGQGFDLQRVSGTGNGLANMQARAVHLGGTLQIDSNPGRGATLVLVFPGSPISECNHE
jgi:signal transduction histidine kinase